MSKPAFVFLSALAVSGCVSTPPPRIHLASAFQSDIARRMLEKGSNSIHGSALIRQRGGGVVSCAGNEVILVPSMSYSDERMRIIYGPGYSGYRPLLGAREGVFADDPPEYRDLTLRTRCDAQGNFRFARVADGSFWITTRIIWQVRAYATPEGGDLMQRVTVKGGEIKEVVLSPH